MIGFLIDMDGLLINSEEIANRTFKELVADLGGTFTDELHSQILGTTGAVWSTQIIEVCRLPISPQEFRDQFHKRYRVELDRSIELMPGAEELLDWIQVNRYKKALVTSSGAQTAQKNLRILGLEAYFDETVSAESIENGKPAPDPYIKGARLLGLQPEECIVLEDSNAGEESGKAAGCTVIAIPTRFANKSDYDKADYVEKTLIDALVRIKGHIQ